jgi:hypothetical protein
MSSNGEKLQEPAPPAAAAAQVPSVAEHTDATQLTCDVLCSLSNSCSPSPADCKEECEEKEMCDEKVHTSGKGCLRQHQLPMFLSSKSCHAIVVSAPQWCSSESTDLFLSTLKRETSPKKVAKSRYVESVSTSQNQISSR